MFLITSTSHFLARVTYFSQLLTAIIYGLTRCYIASIQKEEFSREKIKKSQSLVDAEKYKLLRSETKQLISKKKKAYNKELC